MVITCSTITQEQIRGQISMGGVVMAQTPALKSFNVNYSRNAVTTFSATFEMLAGIAFSLGENVVLSAGVKGSLITRGTCVIEACSTRPAFGKPSYYMVTLQGRGVLSELENKKFSRRLSATGQGMFCSITGGPTNRPDTFYNLDKVVNSGNHMVISLKLDPASGASGENSPYVVFRDSDSTTSGAGMVDRIASKSPGGSSTGGAGLGVHDHTSTTQGGPAFGVFSVD